MIHYHLYDLLTKPCCKDVINKMIHYHLYDLVNHIIVEK